MALTGSPAAISQNNKLTGLDQALYLNPNESRHRYRWSQQVPCSSEYTEHKPSGASGANNDDIAIEAYAYMDQINTIYIVMQRPAIHGKKEYNNQNFVTVKHSRLKKADRQAAERFHKNENEDDVYDDDDTAEAGLSSYVAKVYGCAGPRRLQEFEMSDAETVATATTRDPSRQKYYAYFIEGWIYEMVVNFTVIVGTLVLDMILGRFMYIYHDLSVSETKKVGLRELTGQVPPHSWTTEAEKRAILIERSAEKAEAWLPVPVWHALCTEMSLDIFAWDWSPVEFHIKTNEWRSVVKRANSSTKVVKQGGGSLKDNDLKVSAVVHGIHLDKAEREKIESKPYDSLIIQHHARREQRTFDTLNVRFHQPTICLHIAVQRKAAVRDLMPNWYWGLFERAPVRSMALMFGTSQRQAEMSEMFYRIVMAMERHTATPSLCVYTMGFAFEIESPYPTGSVNMIRWTSVTMLIKLQEMLTTEEIVIWVHQMNWMLIKTDDGVCVPAFNNQSRMIL